MSDMAVAEKAPETVEPVKKKADGNVASPSARHVLLTAGTVVAVVTAAAAFAAGGWIALAAAAGVGTAGAASVARVRQGSRPGARGRRRNWFPGRARRPSTPRATTGKLPWSLTGNQSKRAKSKANGGGTTASPRRRTTLPAITSKGRAKRAAAAAKGASRTKGALGKASPVRPVARVTPKPTARPGARKQAAVKAPGRAPKTPSRTPARPHTRPRLTSASKGSRRAPGAAAPKVSRPSAKRRAVPKIGSTSSRRRTGVTPVSRSLRNGAGRRGVTKPGIKLPGMSQGRRPAVAGLSRGRKLGSGVPVRKATAGARRLATGRKASPGTSKRLARRVPNRTVSRPIPTRPGSLRKLAGTAAGMPRRTGVLRVARPTPAARRQARRVLARHTGRIARQGLAKAAVSPLKAARPLLSALDAQVRGLTAPLAVNPAWSRPPLTPEAAPRLGVEPGPRHTVPEPVRIDSGPNSLIPPEWITAVAPKEAAMSTPTEAVKDAYASIAQFSPENHADVDGFLTGMRDMVEFQAHCLKTLADRFGSEFPFAAPVVETISEMAAGNAALVDHVESVQTAYRSAHAEEINRIENPRPGEEFWDASRNR